MSERGFLSVAALWILAAVSAVALAVLAIGRWHRAHGVNELQTVKALSLAQSAIQLEYASGFEAASDDHVFATGRVHVERAMDETANRLRLSCQVTCGSLEKDVEIGWKRTGGVWRVVSWRES